MPDKDHGINNINLKQSLSVTFAIIACFLHINPGAITCICLDMGMCHYFGYFFGGCSRIFGYLFGLFPGFLGIIFWLFQIFGYHFLVQFDFFLNDSDFGVLILIFPSMILGNVACRALEINISINDIRECCLQGSCFYDSTVLVSVLLCLCKEFHTVYNCYQFEFVYL